MYPFLFPRFCFVPRFFVGRIFHVGTAGEGGSEELSPHHLSSCLYRGEMARKYLLFCPHRACCQAPSLLACDERNTTAKFSFLPLFDSLTVFPAPSHYSMLSPIPRFTFCSSTSTAALSIFPTSTRWRIKIECVRHLRQHFLKLSFLKLS